MDLSSATVAVTGAGGPIGRAVTQRPAADGARAVATDRGPRTGAVAPGTKAARSGGGGLDDGTAPTGARAQAEGPLG